MALHTSKKGLDLPIQGAPKQELSPGQQVSRVALIAQDYVGMRPRFLVEVGDAVKRGQKLFEDKKNPGTFYCAPGAGTVSAINRGARRALQSVVVDLNERERSGAVSDEDLAAFETWRGEDYSKLDVEQVRELLIESGMWSAYRTRPFSKVPAVDAAPAAIFVTAMDTAPFAPDQALLVKDREADLAAGLAVTRTLTAGPVYFCKAPGAAINPPSGDGVQVEEFKGPHPAGNAGYHVSVLETVSMQRQVWYVGLAELLAVGALFRTGKLDVKRTVALAGPGVKTPRLIETRIGASLDQLVEGELEPGDQRVVSGSVLAGRQASGEIHGYLGRYHNTISVVREGREQEFLGWMAPGIERFSVVRLFASKLFPKKQFEFSTNTHGGKRTIFPLGTYERVMPYDTPATFLLRALAVKDTERAIQLGALDLDEEDVALCTFVCPGKLEYGPLLRENLILIEKEG